MFAHPLLQAQRKDLEAFSRRIPEWASLPYTPSKANGEFVPKILPVDSLRFTQTSVSVMTKDKRSTLAQLVAELLLGQIIIEDLELDDVTEAGSHFWSCNNRRLCVLKTCQAASRTFQILLYGIVPPPLVMHPYIQIRCFVQTSRYPFKIKTLADAVTPMCPSHQFTEQLWHEATSYGHTSARVRVAAASGTASSRGSKRETEVFCPDGFAAALVQFCIHDESDEKFLRWAAAGETSANADIAPLNVKAVDALQALRRRVQLALKTACKLPFPPGLVDSSQTPRISKEARPMPTRSRSRSRSPAK